MVLHQALAQMDEDDLLDRLRRAIVRELRGQVVLLRGAGENLDDELRIREALGTRALEARRARDDHVGIDPRLRRGQRGALIRLRHVAGPGTEPATQRFVDVPGDQVVTRRSTRHRERDSVVVLDLRLARCVEREVLLTAHTRSGRRHRPIVVQRTCSCSRAIRACTP